MLEVPDWYRDGKFGIFIHWGLYSVPAFGNEWYPRNMYKQGTPEFAHHVATFGPQSKFGYKDFIPRFKAERFSPADWARLFKDAGAKFVVPVAEHHDGFPMYDCSLTEWSAAKMGPKRDVVGERETRVQFAIEARRGPGVPEQGNQPLLAGRGELRRRHPPGFPDFQARLHPAGGVQAGHIGEVEGRRHRRNPECDVGCISPPLV